MSQMSEPWWTARGVRGIRLDEGQSLISLMIPKPEGRVLTVSENGFGKRTAISQFPSKVEAIKALLVCKLLIVMVSLLVQFKFCLVIK